MPYIISRRRVVQATSLLALASLLPQRVWAQAQDAAQWVANRKAAPESDFDSSATAEDVTEGLDLTGKTAVITGVNSGIGYETMRVLALRGAHVIGMARTLEKAQTACDSVEGQTTPVFCDLADFESIVACTDEIRAMDTPIDMLICNAGIMALPELEQVNGIEKQFVVNHLGHFIFTNRLLDQVKAAPQGRVVVLSSRAHSRAPEAGIDFDNLSGQRGYGPWTAYGQSKLANALFSRELARRLSDTNATCNSLHPGVILTNIVRNLPGYMLTAARLAGWIFMKTIPQGAATSCYVATHPGLVGVSGYYFADCNPLTPDSPHMEDDALAAKLWQVSEELTQNYLEHVDKR